MNILLLISLASLGVAGMSDRAGSARKSRVICAWCKVVIEDGDPEMPVSHGMCLDCEKDFGEET